MNPWWGEKTRDGTVSVKTETVKKQKWRNSKASPLVRERPALRLRAHKPRLSWSGSAAVSARRRFGGVVLRFATAVPKRKKWGLVGLGVRLRGLAGFWSWDARANRPRAFESFRPKEMSFKGIFPPLFLSLFLSFSLSLFLSFPLNFSQFLSLSLSFSIFLSGTVFRTSILI